MDKDLNSRHSFLGVDKLTLKGRVWCYVACVLLSWGVLSPSVTVAADYVIAYKTGNTVYYLARSGTSGVERVTAFNPTTCVWTCASNTSGTAATLSTSSSRLLYQTVNSTKYYLSADGSSLDLSTSGSTANDSYTGWRLNGTKVYAYRRSWGITSNYYINLASGVSRNTTASTASNASAYEYTSVVASTTLATPTLTPTSASLCYGEGQSFTATAASNTVPAHNSFTISGTTYRCYGSSLYTSTDDFDYAPEVTYNWALSGAGSSYVSLDAASGPSVTASVSSQSAVAASATLTVTASVAGASNRTATATVSVQASVATPVISFNNGSNAVTITCGTGGATIRYTLDGSDPTESSTAYTEPFTSAEPGIIKAVAYKDGSCPSMVASYELVKLATPYADCGASGNSCTFSSPDDGVTFYYTKGDYDGAGDFAAPTLASTAWHSGDAAVSVTTEWVVKVISAKSPTSTTGYITSDVYVRRVNTTDMSVRDYVFMYDDNGTVHFMANTSSIISNVTTFNPQTCIWEGVPFANPTANATTASFYGWDMKYEPFIRFRNNGQWLKVFQGQANDDYSTWAALLTVTPTPDDSLYYYQHYVAGSGTIVNIPHICVDCWTNPWSFTLAYNTTRNAWERYLGNHISVDVLGPSFAQFNNPNYAVVYPVVTHDEEMFTLDVDYPVDYFTERPMLAKGETETITATVTGSYRPLYYRVGNEVKYFYYYPQSSEPMNSEPAAADSIHLSYELIGGGQYCELRGNTLSLLLDPGRDLLVTVRVTATPYFGATPYPEGAQYKDYEVHLLTQPPFPSPIISRVEGTNDYQMTCSAANSVIEYRIDDAAPCAAYGDVENTPLHPGWCRYDGPITVNVPGTVISARSYRDALVSDTVQYRVGAARLLPPSVTIDSENGLATLGKNAANSALPAYVVSTEKILYTTDGSDPDPDLYGGVNATQEYDPLDPPVLTNGQSIKAMSIHAGLTHSVVVAATYKKASGLDASGWGVVTLNDYEDHNWSYYQPSDSLPTGYPASLHSPYPRNVKITYYGYGDSTLSTSAVANPAANTFIKSTTETDVKVGIGEEGHTFVYYKTLERDGNNRFPYELIANPFTVRPDVRSYTGTQTLRFNLHDNGGNGWNSHLTIDFSNGRETETVRLHSGSDSTFDITINRGVTVRLTWSAGGGANDECSFTVAYSGGAQIYSSGNGPRSGVLKSFKVEGASYTVSTYTGFHRWRLKGVKNGTIYTSSTGSGAKAKGDTLGAEVTYWFQPTDNALTNAENATSMEVELEALWAPAEVSNGGTSFSKGYNSVERNFSVRRSGTSTNVFAGSTPCTFSSFYPNGTTNGTTVATLNDRLTIRGNGTSGADCKIEYYKLAYGSSGYRTMSCGGYDLAIGRGVTANTTYCADMIKGLDGSSSAADYTIKIESGTWMSLNLTGDSPSSSSQYKFSNTLHVRCVIGNDYDRAKGNNSNLSIAPSGSDGTIYGGKGIQVGAAANRNRLTFDWYLKSGKVMDGVLGNADGGEQSLYIGSSHYTEATDLKYFGRRRITIEGGEISSIAGGVDHTSAGSYQVNDGGYTVKVRMTGGKVNGCIYGAAASSGAYGDRLFILTGGTVGGWVAGGANGIDQNGGMLTGTSYVYVGGTDSVNSNGATTVINRAVGGNVFGAGCGYSTSSSSGQVSGGTNVVLADAAYVERGVYGGGSYGYTEATSNIYILGGTVEGRSGGVSGTSYSGSITGGVYGGSCQNRGGTVNINMTGGLVKTGVYGGSNADGNVSGDVTIHIDGGQMGADAEHPATGVFGGGYGRDTRVLGSVNLTLGTAAGAARHAIIYGDVYGGSAQGRTNGDYSHEGGSVTNVTLNAGKIHGSLYGGGLGTNSNPAYVYGPVQVKVYGGGVHSTTVNGSGAVYGCNNVNGAPQSTVKVDIYDTDDPADGQRYALDAVYGGGNAANYTGNPEVTIHGCNNSIEYVYGGGNAADINGNTTVTIYGADSIGWVFGGGHGDRYAEPPYQADINGNVTVNIYGGTINKVFGGSNSKGPISGSITVNVNRQAEGGQEQCALKIGEMYGGGNEARSHAGTIHIGCTGSGPGEGIRNLFGGANKADVDGSIVLNIGGGVMRNVFGGNNNAGTIAGNVAVNITGGTIDTLFGGNNAGGNITGTIAVTVNYSDVHNCPAPYKLDVVFGGGKDAAYSPDDTTRSNHLTPSVLLVNDTITHDVFGGGKGQLARVLGSPMVQLGLAGGNGQIKVRGDVYGGGDAAPVGQPHIDAVAADPLAEPPVAAQDEVDEVLASPTVKMLKGVVGGSIFGGGLGTTADVTGSTVVDVRGASAVYGSVYGGGNAGGVSGNTDVRIGATE